MKIILLLIMRVKAGLHRYGNTNAECDKDAYVHVGKFVNCSAFAETANWPYINVLYANSLWCTDSQRIAFGCSLNIRHTAECCLPRLWNTSTSNVRIIFECRVRIRILFAFRCKRGLTKKVIYEICLTLKLKALRNVENCEVFQLLNFLVIADWS